jgi:hypothetical protein
VRRGKRELEEAWRWQLRRGKGKDKGERKF